MKTVGHLIGLPVITIYAVTDYQIDAPVYVPSPLRLMGFRLKNGKNNQIEGLLSVEAIEEIGDSSVCIDKEACISLQKTETKPQKNDPPELNLAEVDILDENGRILAIIKDVVFEEKTGKIKGLIISQGLFTDLSRGYAVIPWVDGIQFANGEMMLNQVDFADLLVDQQGGLQKLFGIDRGKQQKLS